MTILTLAALAAVLLATTPTDEIEAARDAAPPPSLGSKHLERRAIDGCDVVKDTSDWQRSQRDQLRALVDLLERREARARASAPGATSEAARQRLMAIRDDGDVLRIVEAQLDQANDMLAQMKVLRITCGLD